MLRTKAGLFSELETTSGFLTYDIGIKTCGCENLLFCHSIQDWYPSQEAIRKFWQRFRCVGLLLSSRIEAFPPWAQYLSILCLLVWAVKNLLSARRYKGFQVPLPYTKADEGRNAQGKRQHKLDIEIGLVIPGIGRIGRLGAVWCHVGQRRLWGWRLSCEACC